MSQVEASGHSVEEALERALTKIGATAEDVDVEVLDPGSRGMLGLGARDARVRVTLKEGAAAVAHRLAERLLRLMGFAATVRAREADNAVTLEIRGQGLGALIGRRGATLEAVEVVLGAMVARASGARSRVTVDVEGYWERRREWLERLARQTADRVQRVGRAVQLAPMPSRDRRVIHTVLAEHPAVMTQSSGEGRERRVTIVLRPEELPEAETRDE